MMTIMGMHFILKYTYIDVSDVLLYFWNVFYSNTYVLIIFNATSRSGAARLV